MPTDSWPSSGGKHSHFTATELQTTLERKREKGVSIVFSSKHTPLIYAPISDLLFNIKIMTCSVRKHSFK